MKKPMRPSHFEIGAKYPEKLRKFYEEVFDWKFDKWDSPDMDYWLIMTSDKQSDTKNPGIHGGMTKGPPFAPLTISVEDIDKTIEKIKKMKGRFISEKMFMPEVGTLIYFQDPEGNKFGVIEPVPM